MNNAKYFRTAKGSHVHESFECANQRRAIDSGSPTECAADAMAPCEHCMPSALVADAAAKAAVAAGNMCSNPGVTNARHIESECRDCGKRGKVNRATGKLRAHKAA